MLNSFIFLYFLSFCWFGIPRGNTALLGITGSANNQVGLHYLALLVCYKWIQTLGCLLMRECEEPRGKTALYVGLPSGTN